MEREQFFKRYSRQIFIEEVGVEGQQKILNAQVLIIGAGGLGSPVIQYLLGAGVGKLFVLDDDVVEIHNLNRQCIHEEVFVGKSKVSSVLSYCTKTNPQVKVEVFQERLTRTNVDAFFSVVDIVVDCTDNFESRYLINDACLMHDKPLVYGSILAFEGQFAVFNYKKSKNLRDLFPEIPTDGVDCDAFGVLGPLPGIIGSMMAMEVLKIVLGLDVFYNRYFVMDSRTWQTSILKFG